VSDQESEPRFSDHGAALNVRKFSYHALTVAFETSDQSNSVKAASNLQENQDFRLRFLVSPRVSTTNRTSIRLAVFAQRR